jgi:hypothetical protein
VTGAKIAYREGYNYQLANTYVQATGITCYSISIDCLTLDAAGILTIQQDYAWDGATDAIDTPDFMRGSLVHDALYQLIREGYLPITLRKSADALLIAICKEDGMPWWRLAYVRLAVRKFGVFAVDSENPILYAPVATN